MNLLHAPVTRQYFLGNSGQSGTLQFIDINLIDDTKIVAVVSVAGIVVANCATAVASMDAVVNTGQIVRAILFVALSIQTSRRNLPFPRLSKTLRDSSMPLTSAMMQNNTAAPRVPCSVPALATRCVGWLNAYVARET